MPLPQGLSPMLATSGALPPDDGTWAYEVKWDGVRALVAVEEGSLRLTSRNGNDVTASYPELAGLASVLGRGPALLDGEVVAFHDGRSDFGRLQARMHVGRPAAALLRSTPVTLLLFDVLHLGGRTLLDEPYDLRRAWLDSLGLDDVQDDGGPGAEAAWQVPPAFLADGQAVLDATRAQGLEGVVAKRRDSRYLPGRRSDCWRKVKHVRTTSAVIAGWKPGGGARSGRIGSLLLGVAGPSGLEYAGHVGTGFSTATLARLAELLAPLRRPSPPFAAEVPREHARTAVWVDPVLVCDVDYAEWTRDGRLRHPSYKGLRDDVDPARVTRA